MQRVDNLKLKLKNLKENVVQNVIKQPQMQIPQMGFTDYSTVSGSSSMPSFKKSEQPKDETDKAEEKPSDQEVFEAIEAIYFTEKNENIGIHELKKLLEDGNGFEVAKIEENISLLKAQHNVISKKVLQLILSKRPECTSELKNINDIENTVQESIWVCQKARSYLHFAKKHLTTSSLEILSAYKKRQTLTIILEILHFFQELKHTNQKIQDLIRTGNFSEAVSILLLNKDQTEKYSEFSCTESLKQKLQETLDDTEMALDNALNGITQNFDVKVYENLINAYKLLSKTHLAMDQLQMNFISAIHTTAFNVLKENLEQQVHQKLLFEQMCENLTCDSVVPCLVQLCKSFWRILVSYHQLSLWHSNYKIYQKDPDVDLLNDDYIHEKLRKGQARIWSDVQAKMCTFISSTRVSHLKYENFMQVLSIVQRMKKVGIEFCDDHCSKMIEVMKSQSIDFFERYHAACLDELNLFIEHEVWIQVMSFTSVIQLQEFKTVKRALKRHNLKESGRNEKAVLNVNSPNHKNRDVDELSQDESSIYGSCGYFVRFSEKSSPFENLYDQKMLEEDILSGIADETSCYYSEDSSDNDLEGEKISDNDKSETLAINNTSLNLLRIIGRYLQMCRLLYAISTHIIHSMTELIDFYVISVYELFAKDLTVPSEALHSAELKRNLSRISASTLAKLRKWPPDSLMVKEELGDPEQFFGLTKRINAVESCNSVISQFVFLHGYLDYLLEGSKIDNVSERLSIKSYTDDIQKCVCDMSKPIFICVTARAIDIPATIAGITKVKWDISQLDVEHNSYIDVIIRASQLFAMRLEEIAQSMKIPKESLWDCYAHVVTHVLVEGYSNAKKCTAAGRALMILDFTHFLSILEVLSGMKHPAHQKYVDQYLKAFYLGSALEEFIMSQNSYSAKHMIGLINCACNDKRLRQKLLGLVENSSDQKV